MNKTDLSKAVAAQTGITQTLASTVLEAVLEQIVDQVSQGEKVTLQGFGAFSVKDRAERMAVKPGTTERIVVPAKKVVKFAAGTRLKF